jgi:hypothetical protein
MQHALATGQDVDQFSDLAGLGIGVIDSLAYSLKEHKTFDFRENVKREPEWNFWKHEEQPGVLIKARKFPYMDRSNVEEAATTYLDLPYRAPFLERTIVDVLIALELYAYSKEMLEKPMPGFSADTIAADAEACPAAVRERPVLECRGIARPRLSRKYVRLTSLRRNGVDVDRWDPCRAVGS